MPKKLDRAKILKETFYRQFEIDREPNDEDRSIELAFASEEPGEQWFGTEILSITEDSIKMDRLRSGAALLVNHDWNDQVGVVESARIDKDKIARAVVRFSRSARGEEIYGDVKDKIRKLVSFGYRILDMVEEKRDGESVYRVTKFEPYEISIVAVPMDMTVGVGRTIAKNNLTQLEKSSEVTTEQDLDKEKQNMNNLRLLDPKGTDGGAPTVDVEKIKDESRKSETARIAEISAISESVREKKDCSELERVAIRDNWTVESYRKQVFDEILKLKPAPTPQIGMDRSDIKRFSLMRAIQQILKDKKLSGLEREVSDAAAKHYGRTNLEEGTIVLPEDLSVRDFRSYPGWDENEYRRMRGENLVRAQNVTTATAGGFTVATVLGDLIELLRNETVLGQAGVTDISGLVGDVALPQQTGGATAYWVSETGALTDSEATFAQKVLTPHRLGATIPFTTQFLAQSSLPAEAWLNQELMRVIGIKLDLAGLLGSGVQGEPLGVANTTGINATVTYGGAADWADIVEHETGIAVDNAIIGAMSFIIDAATVGKWKTKLRDSVAGATYLINPDNNTVNGYQYLRTNQISSTHQSFFGVWNQLIRATWAGREVVVDPYALKKSGQIEITMNQMHDYLVRQPLAFNVSTDSAAQ